MTEYQVRTAALIPAPDFGQLRKGSRLSQRQIAEALDVTVVTVWKWEAGRSRPSIDKLPGLAALLRCSMEDLVAALIRTKGGGDDGEV